MTASQLEGHFAYLEAEFGAARRAPLSARRARLVVHLIDTYVDRLFAASAPAGDILDHRAAIGLDTPALGIVLDLAAARPGGAAIVTEAVTVPLAEYPALGIEDFMVSLYNEGTVQRLLVALPDGGRLPLHEVLAEALTALRALTPAMPGKD